MQRTYVLSLAAMLSYAAVPAFGVLVNTVTDTTPAGATVDDTVNGGEYVGTVTGGGTGFGGPVGNGTLSVDSDSSGVYFGFSNMGDISGNSIRVYFDTKAGGFNNLSDSSGFNDFADFGRERVSRPASAGLQLPFFADYGWIISSAFGSFQSNFELATGGNGSLIAANTGNNASAIGDSPSSTTYEFFLTYANLGVTPGLPANVDFVVIYANNSDQDNAFMSNEGFPFQGGGNPGNGPHTINEYHRLVTVPEPASIGLLGIAAMGLLARRRNH